LANDAFGKRTPGCAAAYVQSYSAFCLAWKTNAMPTKIQR